MIDLTVFQTDKIISNFATKSLIVIAKLHMPTNFLIVLLGKDFSIIYIYIHIDF